MNDLAFDPTACRASMYRKLVELIRPTLHAERHEVPIRPTDRLTDLGLSSLRLIGLVVTLEDEFRLSPRAIGKVRAESTLNELLDLCLEDTAPRSPRPNLR